MADRADQREIALIGAGKDQAAVVVLEHIDIVAVEQAADHDLADLGGAERRRRHPQHGVGDGSGPGAGGVHQRPCGEHLAMAAVDHGQPPDVGAVGADAARAGADVGAALGGIHRAEDDQAGIVDHAIGIFERRAERPLQRIADRMVGDVDGRGSRQMPPRADRS